VLAEVPELAQVLACEVDRTTFRLVEALIHLRAHGIAETTTGVSLDQWLAAIGRRTHADRRMLVTTADLCRRLPSLRAAMRAGEVSWAQVRTRVCQVQGLARELDDEVDGAIAKAVQAAAGDHPDELGRVLRWGLDRLRPRWSGCRSSSTSHAVTGTGADRAPSGSTRGTRCARSG
jgi:hypothetical protein